MTVMNLFFCCFSFFALVVGGASAQACGSELNLYKNCVFRLDAADGGACQTCLEVEVAEELATAGTCEFAQSAFCTAITETCLTCGECDDEFEAYIACDVREYSNGACVIDCGTTPTPVADDGPLCEEFNEYATCVVTELSEEQGAECDACRLQAESVLNDGAACDTKQSVFCNSVQTCNCGPCSTALEAYFTCDTAKRTFGECQIDCSSVTAPPTPSPAVDCPTSFDSYRNCVFRLDADDGKACDACRLEAAAEIADGSTCDFAQEAFCTAVTDTCSTCGDCDDELENYLACDVLASSNGNCQIDCGTTPTDTEEGPLCGEFNDYAVCVVQQLTEAEGVVCDACRLDIAQSIPDGSSCDVSEEVVICDAIQMCECGSCTEALAAFLICDTAKRTFGECQIDCSVDASSKPTFLAPQGNDGPTPTAPFPAPTPAPTSSSTTYSVGLVLVSLITLAAIF